MIVIVILWPQIYSMKSGKAVRERVTTLLYEKY